MLLYRCITAVCVILIIIIQYLKLHYRYFRKKYIFKYSDYRAKSINKNEGLMAIIYEPTDDSEYISEISLNKIGLKKYFVAKYKKSFKNISYFIYIYGKSQKLLKVLELTDSNPLDTSKVIKLPKKTKMVNIHIKSCNDEVYNLYAIEPMKRHSILLYTLLNSLELFMLGTVIRQVILEIINPIYANSFLDSNAKINELVYRTIVTVIYMIITVIFLFARNGYFRRKRGTIYDF